MTVEEMKQRKKELGYSNEKLSELSGVTAWNGAESSCGSYQISKI